jgi:hypothetical protein
MGDAGVAPLATLGDGAATHAAHAAHEKAGQESLGAVCGVQGRP